MRREGKILLRSQYRPWSDGLFLLAGGKKGGRKKENSEKNSSEKKQQFRKRKLLPGRKNRLQCK